MEVAKGESIAEIADNFFLDKSVLTDLFRGLAAYLDRKADELEISKRKTKEI